ncbi:MAG: hypothetical protein JXR37_27290 [Kiritimatiellae bacterium]|nr:hypothetical protein [Kiritimatiellia bacterium]
MRVRVAGFVIAVVLACGAHAEAPRDALLWPYAVTSAWNRPIGANAVYSTESDPETRDMTNPAYRWGINAANGYGIVTAIATESDPLMTVTCRLWVYPKNAWAETPVGQNLPYRLHWPRGVRHPVQYRGTRKAEGRLAEAGVPAHTPTVIYDATTGYTHEFYEIAVLSDTQAFARIHFTDDPDPTRFARTMGVEAKKKVCPEQNIVTGTGHPPPDVWPGKVGPRAAGLSFLGGALRAWEINAPGTPIRHALALALSRDLLIRECPDRRDCTVWPAADTDGNMKQQKGTLKYGMLIAIPPPGKGGPDLEALGLSETALRLAVCMRDYGLYVVDQGHARVLCAESTADVKRLERVRKELNRITPFLRVVRNNRPEEPVVGGGAPLCGMMPPPPTAPRLSSGAAEPAAGR